MQRSQVKIAERKAAPVGKSPRAVPEVTGRSPVQFSAAAKAKLDHIKQAENLDSYNDVVDNLYRMWKRSEPSAAGTFPGVGPFEREGDDLHRVPH
jgi:hypothetical protein